MNEWTWLGICLIYPGYQLGRIFYQLYAGYRDKIRFRQNIQLISKEIHDRWKNLGLE